MKYLYLVRHGKAVAADGKNDAGRELTGGGREGVTEVAESLARRNIMPGRIIASPAPRAAETARILAERLGCPVEGIEFDPRMYEQRDDILLEIVRELPDDLDAVMLVGHNPSMEGFAAYLTGGAMGAMCTSAVAAITCSADEWREVNYNQGAVEFFEYPGAKPRRMTRKELRREVRDTLLLRITEILAGYDSAATDEIATTILDASKDIARRFAEEAVSGVKKSDGEKA